MNKSDSLLSNLDSARACSTSNAEILNAVLRRPLLREIVNTSVVQRLTRISFLGAIDYVQSSRPFDLNSHNRFRHTVGVAALAINYAALAGVSEKDLNLISVAAMLHDIGHGPLSHSLEPIFFNLFQLNHHEVCEEILRGRSKYGSEINSILKAYDVDPGEVLNLISSHDDGELGFLFSGPFNIDTLEGISRSYGYISEQVVWPDPHRVLEQLLVVPHHDTPVLDSFWRLKEGVYRYLINGPTGFISDQICQDYMQKHWTSFSREDFFLDEPAFFRLHPGLSEALRVAREGFSRLVVKYAANQRLGMINLDERSYEVDQSVIVSSINDLSHRYRVRKSKRATTNYISNLDLKELSKKLEKGRRSNSSADLFDDGSVPKHRRGKRVF